MKTFITSLTIVFVCAAFLGCINKDKTSIEVVVLRDVTDSNNVTPTPPEILNLFDFTDDKLWDEKHFRYSTLSDVSYNLKTEVSLTAENRLLSNEIVRKKSVAKFKEDLSQIVSGIAASEKPHSSVYLPIARELTLLSQSNVDQKVLIIFSDLMENRPQFSLYNKENIKVLETNPDSVKELFNQWQTLPSLSGIEVHLIYQPKDADSDTTFILVSNFYKKLLEEKGAQVTISANL